MYRRRKGRVKKIIRKWGVFMSAILKQKLIDIANGFTKYGLWKDTGSSNLSELDDVTLTNLQTNDVLTYNGSKWVNDDNLQTQIDTLNSNLLKKLSAEVILNASTFMLLKINNSYIFIGYFIADINAWTWIVKLDEKYTPIMNVTTMDGKIRLDPSGVIQTTTNISGGTSYMLFYTIL